MLYTRVLKYLFLITFAMLLAEAALSDINEFATGSDQLNSHEVSIFPFSDSHFRVLMPYSLQSLVFEDDMGIESIDLFNLSDHSKRINTLFLDGSVTWFSMLSYKGGNSWQFSISEQFYGGLGLSKDLVQLLGQGNRFLDDQNAGLKLLLSELHFQKISYSRQFVNNEIYKFGYSVNLYSGKSIMNLDLYADMTTAASFDEIQLKFKGKGGTSVPLVLNQFTGDGMNQASLKNYIFEVRNPGIGIDLFVDFDLSTNANVKVGVNDLGGILWNANTTLFQMNDELMWSGLDMSGDFDFKKLSNIRNHNEIVSLRDTFLNNLIIPIEHCFMTLAPVEVFGNLIWGDDGNRKYRAGINVKKIGQFYRYDTHVLTDFKLGKFLTISSGWNATNQIYFNVPLSVRFKGESYWFLLGLYDALSVISPGDSRCFGGFVSARFRVGRQGAKKLKINKQYPFYQPLERKGYFDKLF